MIRFECDYAEGAHERILRRLFETNLEQTPGYGEDHYCDQARAYIRDLCRDDSLAPRPTPQSSPPPCGPIRG